MLVSNNDSEFSVMFVSLLYIEKKETCDKKSLKLTNFIFNKLLVLSWFTICRTKLGKCDESLNYNVCLPNKSNACALRLIWCGGV